MGYLDAQTFSLVVVSFKFGADMSFRIPYAKGLPIFSTMTMNPGNTLLHPVFVTFKQI